MEIWCVEGHPGPLSEESARIHRVIVRSHKEARDEGHRMLTLGYRVIAWDMMGSGQFRLK